LLQAILRGSQTTAPIAASYADNTSK